MGKIEAVKCEKCGDKLSLVEMVIEGAKVKFWCTSCCEVEVPTECLSGMDSCGPVYAIGLCQKCINSFAREKREHERQPELF